MAKVKLRACSNQRVDVHAFLIGAATTRTDRSARPSGDDADGMDGRGPAQVRAGDPGGAAAGHHRAAGADDGRARPAAEGRPRRVWSTLTVLPGLVAPGRTARPEGLRRPAARNAVHGEAAAGRPGVVPSAAPGRRRCSGRTRREAPFTRVIVEGKGGSKEPWSADARGHVTPPAPGRPAHERRCQCGAHAGPHPISPLTNSLLGARHTTSSRSWWISAPKTLGQAERQRILSTGCYGRLPHEGALARRARHVLRLVRQHPVQPGAGGHAAQRLVDTAAQLLPVRDLCRTDDRRRVRRLVESRPVRAGSFAYQFNLAVFGGMAILAAFVPSMHWLIRCAS